MVDIVDKATRSRMMSGIRSRDTKPEMIVRKALHRAGFRYRLSSKISGIKPDIVLTRYRVAVFVHGCYWHQHKGCKLAYSDRNYSDKWKKKFEDNRLRDKRVLKMLLAENWRVAVIWECTTRDARAFDRVIEKLQVWLKAGKSQYFESDYRKT